MDSYLHSSSPPGLLYKAIDDVAKLSSAYASPYQTIPIEPQWNQTALPPPPVYPPAPIREFNISFTAPYSSNPPQVPSHSMEMPHAIMSPPVPSSGPARIDYSLSVQRQRAAMNRDRYKKVRFCVFCQSSKQPEHVYRSHILKDTEGRVVCPYLRSYTCPLCNANGDDAHTIKYCPLNQPTIIFT